MQQTSSALPMSNAATRATISSVWLVSSSTPPPPRGHQHGCPQEPQGPGEADPRAQGDTEGPTAQLPASDLESASRPKTYDVSGQPAPFSALNGPPTGQIRDLESVSEFSSFSVASISPI